MRKLKNENGFTIIEVLIVLAIAALIMVVVFLAVPGLQRNQRNTQTRTEANNVLSAVSELQANKGGAAISSADAGNVISTANTKTITSVTVEGSGGTTAATSTTAVVRTGAKCSAPDANATNAGVNSRQTAVVFMVETSGGGTQVQCINS